HPTSLYRAESGYQHRMDDRISNARFHGSLDRDCTQLKEASSTKNGRRVKGGLFRAGVSPTHGRAQHDSRLAATQATSQATTALRMQGQFQKGVGSIN